MVHGAPQCWVWVVSLCFCFLHLILSIIALALFFCSKFLDPLDFSSCPLALYGHLWWLRIFFYAPQYCLGTFIVEDFFMPQELFGHFQSLWIFCTCPPVWGVILAKVIFQEKFIRLKRGLQRIYFSIVKRLSKIAFLHLKCMHLGSVSLAFMRVCRVISHYSCK